MGPKKFSSRSTKPQIRDVCGYSHGFFRGHSSFWMEPLVGRMLTPYFGGAANVWLLCLMFFQAMLLLGYLYAHLLAKKVGPYHLLVLLVPFVNLPLRIQAEFNPYSPLWNVLSTLITYVALPFVVLSTTAVVAQSWLSRSAAGRSYEPYPLYAVSNAGALIALIGYTFLVEPFLGLRQLSLAWTGVYIIYAFFACFGLVSPPFGKGL